MDLQGSFRTTRAQIQAVLARRLASASVVVGFLTRAATWLVLGELTFLGAAATGPLRGRSLEDVLKAIGPQPKELDLPVVATLIAFLFCLGVAAVVTNWVCHLALRFVVDEWKEADRRHVAYAWLSGAIGLALVFIETVSPPEFLSEDLLIGAGGLNMLVEEMRILRDRFSGAGQQRDDPEELPGRTSGRPRRWVLEGAAVVLLLWAAVEHAGVLNAVSTRAGSTTVQSADPAVSALTLRGEPRNEGVVLRWSVSAAFEGRPEVEYQQALLNEPYPETTERIADGPARFVVGGLSNGRVYVFRMRVGGGVWSNEISVVPMPELGGRREARRLCTPLGIVGFERDDDRLGPRESRATLERIVEHLEERAGAPGQAVAAGYASARGRASYNLDLSERRAAAVVEYLLEETSVRPISARAWGEQPDEAVSDSDDEREHQVVVVSWCNESPRAVRAMEVETLAPGEERRLDAALYLGAALFRREISH